MAQPSDMQLCQEITWINDETGTGYMKKETVLGKGNFGIVFRGFHQCMEVAVKRLDLHRLDQEDREVNLQTKLEHENVVQILAVEEDDTFRYIVLELCAGTLGQVIDKTYEGPALPPDRQVLQEITRGLIYIHSQKLIHRDIKPDNILISITGQMKLSDFGLSKQISQRDTCSMSGTRGTRLWMAPEFYGCNETTKATPKCDVFPCGCVFFVFLTRENGGIHPFGDSKDPIQSIQIPINIREGNPVNIGMLDSNHFAVSIIRRMIERDPQKRISLSEVNYKLYGHNCFARENNATEAEVYDATILAQGTVKNVYKGKYLIGERAGEECVFKTFKTGCVFEDFYFQEELKMIEKAHEIINNFNKNKIIRQTIWLNKPEIWTFSPGSTREGEKVLVEPMISNFKKFNSSTGWTPEKSSYWIKKMQALSHYSYHSTDGHLLLCDLQGEATGSIAVITDPIIMSSTREYGPTDLGDEGISTFFANHTCNKYCDSKWMIPYTTYFDESSLIQFLNTELAEFHLIDQTQENELTY